MNEINNPIRYIKSLAMDIIVVVVAFAYIGYQMITLEPTELNILVLIAQAVMGIICGVVIKQALGENGFSKGYNSEFWRGEEKKYNEVCGEANEHMDKVDNFYQFEEIAKKREFRRQHLQAKRLKYDMWFDKDGNYIGTKVEYKKLDFWQKHELKKCIKIKIYPLNLFSQYSITIDQFTKREATDSKQRASSVAKNTLSAVVVAVIGVYFIPQLNHWSWASLISATMQVSMWVLFGVVQLYENYNFVIDDKTALLRTKKETIKRFVSGAKNHIYDNSPYYEKPLDTNIVQA